MNYRPMYLVFILGFAAGSAGATELVYQPVNPVFGGRPLNGAVLLNNAEAQNNFKDPDQRDRNDLAAEFIHALQSRLLSGLANQVVDAIFGENAAASGTITFDTQTITFNHGLEMITIDILDTSTGAVTTIEIPTLQLEP